MPDIVIDQFPDFLGHLAVQDAGKPFVDLLPIERDGLGGGAQELRRVVRLSDSTVSYRHSPTRSSLAFGSQKTRYPGDTVIRKHMIMEGAVTCIPVGVQKPNLPEKGSVAPDIAGCKGRSMLEINLDRENRRARPVDKPRRNLSDSIHHICNVS